jgi:hypothetical protein
MTAIFTFLLSFLSGGGSIILPALVSLLALVGAFFGLRRSGYNQAQAEAKASTYKKAYENEVTRKQVEQDLRNMSDDELERLRQQYTSE